MNSQFRDKWMAASAIAIIAAGAGYGIARWTAPRPSTEAASTEAATPSHLKLADREIAAAGILVETANVGDLSAEVLAPAITAAEPSGVASLMAHAEGVISLLNKRLGDPVRAGEVLALVDSKDAAQLASDRASAAAKAVLARRVAEQEAALFKEGATSQRSLQTAQAALEAAEADARRAREAAVTANLARDGHSVEIISPLSGRITAQNAALGAFVRTETELFRVSDPRFVRVEAQVSATDAAKVHPGDAAILLLPSGGSAQATVRSVTPALDPQTRTQTIVISPPEQVLLAPGETLQARILPKGAKGRDIVVPDDAIQSLDGRDTVFLRTPDGFDVRHVSVGTRSGGQATVITGIRPGDRVATRNAFLLKAEIGKGGEGDE